MTVSDTYYISLCSILLVHSLVVSVRWESSSYTVSETSGSVELTLLPEGTTSYDITLTVTTLAGSATGIINLYWNN